MDGSSAGAVSSYTFTNVQASHTISASFTLEIHQIAAIATTGGSISPSGIVNVLHGYDQAFTITADTGYHILDVTVDGPSVGAVSSYTFISVQYDHNIVATFEADTYIITASAGTGGSITPSGSVVVNYGDDQEFTIEADTGYDIADVLVDGSSAGAVSSYTFTNVQASHTISASFTLEIHQIAAIATTGGSISPSGIVNVLHGYDQAFTITADTGYHILDVTVDGPSVGAVSSYTFISVQYDHNIVATFEADTYTITASAGTGGSITPQDAVTVNYGADQTFTITADTGYHIADVLVDGSSVGAVSSYTFTNVVADHTIQAQFAENPLRLWMPFNDTTVPIPRCVKLRQCRNTLQRGSLGINLRRRL